MIDLSTVETLTSVELKSMYANFLSSCLYKIRWWRIWSMKQYKIQLYPVNWLVQRFLLCRTASPLSHAGLLLEVLLIAGPLSVFAILCIDHQTRFHISYTLWAVHSNLFHVFGNYRTAIYNQVSCFFINLVFKDYFRLSYIIKW